MNEATPVLGLGLGGRMGRLSYATCGALCTALVLLAALHLITSPTNARLLAYGVFFLATFWLCLRWTALRLHDMNFSAWWGVLLWVPYVGAVAGVVFSFMPGTADDNDHGPRPNDGNWFLFLPAITLLCISAWVSVPTFLTLADEDAEAEVQSEQAPGRAPNAQTAVPDIRSVEEARTAFRARYRTASDPRAFALSAGGAWGISLAATTADDAVTAAMVDCETRRQPAAPPCRLINMNGQGSEPE